MGVCTKMAYKFARESCLKRGNWGATLKAILRQRRMQRVLAVVRSRVRTDSAVLARISQRRCLSSLEGGGGGAKDGRKAPIFPWVLAGLTGSMTLYAAKVAESGDLFKSVVQEIHRAQGLQNLQLVMMTFGGRWTEEFRAKLAANGAVEALIPLVLRLNTEFKEAYNKLEQARQLQIDEKRLMRLQAALSLAFQRREICYQVLGITLDDELGRERFFSHNQHAEVCDAVLSSAGYVDGRALTDSFSITGAASIESQRSDARVMQRLNAGLKGDRESNIRAWTAAESLLVAGLAGDERGQVDIACYMLLTHNM